MKNRAYVIESSGRKYDLDLRPTLLEAQKIVGGYIEILSVRGTRKSLIVNEDGRPLKLNPNIEASRQFGVPLFGNVIVMEGWKTVKG